MSDPLSIIASLVAVLQLSTQAVTYLKDVKVGSDDRNRVRDELRNAICLLEMLKDRAEETTDSELQASALITLTTPGGPLESYQKTIEELITKLVGSGSREASMARSLRWPFEKKEVEKLLVTLEHLKSHFNLIIQNDIIGLAKLAHTKLDTLSDKILNIQISQNNVEEYIVTERDDKILQWITPLEFEARQADIFARVQPGTGEWILTHELFRKWCEEDIQTIWCPGMPGAGKTFITATVINNLRQRVDVADTVVTFLYCDFQAKVQQTTLQLVGSILRQILSKTQVIPQELVSLYNDSRQIQVKPSLSQYISILRETIDQFSRVFIVVDALDELTDTDRVGLMTELQGIGSNIRLFCTSRSLTEIAANFENDAQIKISAQDQDVRLFLSTQIDRASRLARHVQAVPALRNEIIDTIASKVEGMFLLAKLHIESLASKLSRKDIRKQLQHLPKTLDDTYAQALIRIRSQSEEDNALAERILFWIACSERQLSIKELQQMFATWSLEADECFLEDDALPDGNLLTSVCGGLVITDSHSASVRLVHYTAQMYFERNHIDKLQATREGMMSLNIKYLSLDNFSEPCQNDVLMEQRLKDYPYIDYAVRYWGTHIDSSNLDDLWPEVQACLQNKGIVEIMSQVESIPPHRYPGWSQRYPRNVSPLVHVASFDNSSSLLLRLIKEGQSTEGSGSDGQTALMKSAALGHLSNVVTLRRAGALLDIQDSSRQTAVMHAGANGHTDVVRFLTSEDPSGVHARDLDGWTVLMISVTSGNIHTVQHLLEAGADINVQSPDGDTPLSIAARRGVQDIFDLLICSNAKLPTNSTSRRALRIAKESGLKVNNVIWEDDVVSISTDSGPNTLVRRSTMRTTNANFNGSGNTLVAGRAESNSGTPRFDNTTIGRVRTQRSSNYIVERDKGDSSTRNIATDIHLAVSFRQRYRQQKLLGTDVFARVYSCADKITGDVYLVKVYDMLSDLISPRRLVKLGESVILEEVRLLSSLRHESIMKIHDLAAEDGYLYMVCDLAKGEELFYRIVRERKLTQTDTRKIYLQVLSALQYVHERKIMHRDIKAENIWVRGEDLNVMLVGFELATNIESDGFETELCGTSSYAAPEILTGNQSRRYSCKVDIWSAGVVLYICLCGFPPFSDELYSRENPYTLAQQIRLGRFDYPSPYWDEIPGSALDLIDAMITVDPERRFTAQQCQQHSWMGNEDTATDALT